MAVTSSFKQQCPSCEAMVPIRDPGMIGKKIDCPKCKYRFMVEDPVEKDKEAVTADKGRKGKTAPAGRSEDVKTKVKANGRAAVKTPTRRLRDAEDEDDDDDGKKKAPSGKFNMGLVLAGVGVVALAVAAFFIFRGGSGAQKPDTIDNKNIVQNDPNQNQPQGDPGEKKEKGGPEPRTMQTASAAGADLTNFVPNDPETAKDPEHIAHFFFRDLLQSPLRDTAFAQTGLVDQYFKKRLGFSIMAVDDLIRAERYTAPAWTFTIVHGKDPFDLEPMKEALGLKPAEPIKKQEYYQVTKNQAWLEQFGRVSLGAPEHLRHLTARAPKPLYVRLHDPQTLIFGEEVPVVAFLKLEGQFPNQTKITAAPQQQGTNPDDPNQPAEPENPDGPPKLPPGGRGPPGAGPKMPGPQGPAGVSPPGGPPGRGGKGAPGGKAGEQPNGLFQGAGLFQGVGLFQDAGGGRPGYPGSGGYPGGGFKPPYPGIPGQPGQPGQQEQQPPQLNLPTNTYMTIKSNLKAILDRLESTPVDSKQKVLYSSVTDMDAARIASKNPMLHNRSIYQYRQLWDVTHLMHERNLRVRLLGTSVVQREGRSFSYRSEASCPAEADAKELHKALVEEGAPSLAKFIDLIIGLKLEVPKIEQKVEVDPNNPGGEPGGNPNFPGGLKPPAGAFPPGGLFPPGGEPGGEGEQMPKKPEEPQISRITVDRFSRDVNFNMDLVMDQPTYGRAFSAVALMMNGLKGEITLLDVPSRRHELAAAVKALGEKGLSDRGIGPGQFPPAAFPRTNAGLRTAREPNQRISWMAGLLPYLGHDAVYRGINFDASWKDPSNWMAGRTLIPEFQDPMYPDSARFTSNGAVVVDLAAAHFAGISGIGPDAADYAADDPANAHRRGVFGYDRSLSLAEISKGRGAANTIVLIQVPHDGPAGVTPWIAGGGATVRGVPEKNSIAPFVLTKDRNGKQINHNGKHGTFVQMADGSVRFLDAGISDDVFKAMCTVKGPAPANTDWDSLPESVLVPPPAKAAPPTTPAPAETKPPSPAETPTKMPDAQITELLVGKWAIDFQLMKGSHHYTKDGSFYVDASIKDLDKWLQLSMAGTWKVSDGVLIETITKTNMPELLKVGHVSRARVVFIDQSTLRFRGDDGKEIVRQRVKD